MIRSIVKKISSYKKSDIDKLIHEATKFPRYQHHHFLFRDWQFFVTDFLSVAYQLKEYLEDGRMNFISSIASPVIYDCGANVGISILYYKNIYPNARIIAFEPDPKVFKCLQQNLEINHISQVDLINKAVWINNDGIDFGSEGADGGSIFFENNKIRLPSIRLKELLVKENRIDLLKLDIEGAETNVLNDCKDELNKINYLFVEYHSWKNQPQQLDQLLNNLSESGFRYYLHSIGENLKQPFIQSESSLKMDIQLDIHAINTKYKK